MKNCYQKYLLLSSLLLATLLASACNQKNPTSQAVIRKSPPPMRTVKPHANVYMEYKVAEDIQPTQVFALDISILSGMVLDDIKLQLRMSQGLETADVLVYSLGPQQAGQKNPLQLSLQAFQNGDYRVYLTASLIKGEAVQSRSFIIPLRVGEPLPATLSKQKAVDASIQNTAGEKIISLPAKEYSR